MTENAPVEAAVSREVEVKPGHDLLIYESMIKLFLRHTDHPDDLLSLKFSEYE